MRVLVLDNTTAAGFRRCFRYGQHRFREHLVPPLTPSALNFGAAIHRGIEMFYLGKSKDEAISAALSAWRPQEAPIEEKREWRTPSNLADLLLTIFQQEPIPILNDPSGKPLLEIEGLFPLTDKNESPGLYSLLESLDYSNLCYAFIIDAIAMIYDQIYIVDHKTTSMVGGERGEPAFIRQSYFEQYRPHAQTQGYCWGISRFLGKSVNNVLINALGIHSKRIESPNFSSKDYFCFSRFTINYSNEEIEEWRKGMIQLAQQILLAEKSNFFRQNPDACFLFNRRCPYLVLCSQPPALRDTLKSKLFLRDEWNPLTTRKRESERMGTG